MAIITISRGTMSGGESLAKCLSDRLGVPAISQEILQDAARRFGISQALLVEQLEKTKGIVRGLSPERRLYLTAIQLALAERASKGPFVYHGHAGHLLMKGVPGILKVRVIAPMKRRAEKLMGTQNLSYDEAKKTIEKLDEGRIKWTRFLYDVDWRDPSLYDLVINLDAIQIEIACEIVLCTLDQPDFKQSQDSQALIEDFLLASQVKAELATNQRTKGLELEVSADQGSITITGTFETGGIFHGGRHRMKNVLIEVAQKVPGVKKVSIAVEGVPVVLE
jgi:cytidylate kinase